MSRKSFSCLCIVVVCGVGSVYADPSPTGLFTTPISETQTGNLCNTGGYKQDQYHMHLNDELSSPKYHMGEDLNGKCGGDTDEGYPIRAIADGQVVFLDSVGTVSNQGKRLYIRHSFPYARAANGVMTFDSVALHLQAISSNISWASGVGSLVNKGDTVAYLGKTGTTFAHLHWEAQVDLTIPLGTNPYQNPLLKTHALRYRAPSMIVDDRRDVLGYSVPAPGGWYAFTATGNAPSSTMYLVYNGQRKSLKNAITAGWIPAEGILQNVNGGWYPYVEVDDNFFENGKSYAIKTLISGVVHYLPVPRNGFQEDRARLDMLHAVENDSRFVSVNIQTYERIPDWQPSYDLHKMQFNLSSGGTAWVNQLTSKTNPLKRFVTFYDPDLADWTSWVWVNWNRLY